MPSSAEIKKSEKGVKINIFGPKCPKTEKIGLVSVF